MKTEARGQSVMFVSLWHTLSSTNDSDHVMNTNIRMINKQTNNNNKPFSNQVDSQVQPWKY